jgi:hypothetical protein
MISPAKKAKKIQTNYADALAAVVSVGAGRGFVVEGPKAERYVITAAHCLPERPDGQRLPPPHGLSYINERNYRELLAPLGKEPSVWCECLFVDPIADIAVLGSPDNQALSEQADAYEALVEAAIPLTITEPPSKPIPEKLASLKKYGITKKKEQEKWARRECPAVLPSLANRWFPCTVQHAPNGMLNIIRAVEEIAGGMSGSPILSKEGTAIGLVCLGTHSVSDGEPLTAKDIEGGPNPRLMGNLPAWFLATLAVSSSSI